MKTNVLSVLVLLTCFASGGAYADEHEWLELGPAEDLSQWREPVGDWQVVAEVFSDPDNERRLAVTAGSGAMYNGPRGSTRNIFSQHEHGDIEAAATPANGELITIDDGQGNVVVFEFTDGLAPAIVERQHGMRVVVKPPTVRSVEG